MRESSEARNTATRAMSSGCPMRPSGVPAIIAFSKSLPMMPALVRALGLDAARRNRVDPDFSWTQFRGEPACYCIHRAFGPGIRSRPSALPHSFPGAAVCRRFSPMMYPMVRIGAPSIDPGHRLVHSGLCCHRNMSLQRRRRASYSGRATGNVSHIRTQ